MSKEKLVSLVFAAAGLVAAGLCLPGCSDSGKSGEGDTLKSTRRISEAKAEKKTDFRSRRSETKVAHESGKARNRFMDDDDELDAAWLKERQEKVDAILKLMQEVAKGGTLSPGRISRAEALQKILDLGDQKTALSLARKLRLSENRDERLAALDAFGWYGTKGMADVTSMLADPDPELAAEALEVWEAGFEEISDDSLRCELIVDAAKLVENDPEMHSLIMELTQVDSTAMAVETLDTIICAEDTTAAAKEASRDIYQHLSDSEYVDHETAVQKAAEIKAEESQIDPKRKAEIDAWINQLGTGK